MYEIIFSRDRVKIRELRELPIVGKRWFEVEIDYEKLSSARLEITVNSIKKIDNGRDWAIKMDVKSFKMTKTEERENNEISKDSIEIELGGESYIKYGVIPIPKIYRNLFPGYKEKFVIETDIGEITTYITSAPRETDVGDAKSGQYIKKGLTKWFKSHPELKVGDVIVLEVIEPHKRYRLKIKESINKS